MAAALGATARLVLPSTSCLSRSSSLRPSQKQSVAASPSSLIANFQGLRLANLPSQGQSKTFQNVVSDSLQAVGHRNALRGIVQMSVEVGVGLLGTKVGMMTYFTETGQALAVTVVGFHEGNIVTQVKGEGTDGYNAVQIGYKRCRAEKLSKPERGHLEKIETIPLRHLQEFRLPTAATEYTPGQRLAIEEMFKDGDLIDVTANSIGKGFTGGIKRYNFARGLMSHGSKSHRQLGSIGAGTTPGRVYPGKKMPGRMGGVKTKIRKLKIVRVDPELRTILILGAVPGKKGNLLRITPAKIVGKNIAKN
eukprot:jgi/Mesen1/7021/ME000365S06148